MSLFQHTKVDPQLLRNRPEFDINSMYQRVTEELGLQQSKRDQLIMIYLAALAFIVPSLLEGGNTALFGPIFIGLGVVGLLFSLIIIRYRKYKEVYWICCRTLNVMMDMDCDNWTKETIQAIFYSCMKKKIDKYICGNRFRWLRFFFKNLNSSETLYLIVHAILSGSAMGLGVGLSLPLSTTWCIIAGVAAGLVVLAVAVIIYFATLIKVYRVCVTQEDGDFNYTYGDAWFLHFFIAKEDKPASEAQTITR